MTASSHMRLHELRRLRLGELAGDAKLSVESHVAGCADCRARLAALDEEDRVFLASANVAVDTAKILARVEEEKGAPLAADSRLAPISDTSSRSWLSRMFGTSSRSWLSRMFGTSSSSRLGRALGLSSARSWAWRVVPALAAAAVLAVFFVPRATEDTTRIKGGAIELEMFVKNAEGIHPAADGARLREGDAVQFRYRAGGKRYVFVVSVDASGTISPLYPDEARTSIPVSPSGTHVLEDSIILDASRGPERFFAFFSDTPLDFTDVHQALDAELHEHERDVTRLQEVEIGREDVDGKSILIVKE